MGGANVYDAPTAFGANASGGAEATVFWALRPRELVHVPVVLGVGVSGASVKPDGLSVTVRQQTERGPRGNAAWSTPDQ
jgi:hypothetical protein